MESRGLEERRGGIGGERRNCRGDRRGWAERGGGIGGEVRREREGNWRINHSSDYGISVLLWVCLLQESWVTCVPAVLYNMLVLLGLYVLEPHPHHTLLASFAEDTAETEEDIDNTHM